jgi:hypothetical protein
MLIHYKAYPSDVAPEQMSEDEKREYNEACEAWDELFESIEPKQKVFDNSRGFGDGMIYRKTEYWNVPVCFDVKFDNREWCRYYRGCDLSTLHVKESKDTKPTKQANNKKAFVVRFTGDKLTQFIKHSEACDRWDELFDSIEPGQKVIDDYEDRGEGKVDKMSPRNGPSPWIRVKFGNGRSGVYMRGGDVSTLRVLQ